MIGVFASHPLVVAVPSWWLLVGFTLGFNSSAILVGFAPTIAVVVGYFLAKRQRQQIIQETAQAARLAAQVAQEAARQADQVAQRAEQAAVKVDQVHEVVEANTDRITELEKKNNG